MPEKIKHKSGAIEYITSQDEKDIRKLFKDGKKAVKLTEEQKEKILFVILKELKLI